MNKTQKATRKRASRKTDSANHVDRLERHYADAAEHYVNQWQSTYDKAWEAVGMLIDQVALSIEWNQEENRRRERAALAKGVLPPAPPSTLGALEAIARCVVKLQDARFDKFRGEDPNKGAQEISRILELARKEYGIGQTETTINNRDKGTGGEGVKNCQNPAPQESQEGTDPPSGNRNWCIGRGIVKR